MATQASKRFILDEYSLDPATRLLVRNGGSVPLQRRPFQVLLYLIEQRERLVSRAELLELFWEGHDVYDETLTKCVGKIRKALNDQQEMLRVNHFAHLPRARGATLSAARARPSCSTAPRFDNCGDRAAGIAR